MPDRQTEPQARIWQHMVILFITVFSIIRSTVITCGQAFGRTGLENRTLGRILSVIFQHFQSQTNMQRYWQKGSEFRCSITSSLMAIIWKPFTFSGHCSLKTKKKTCCSAAWICVLSLDDKSQYLWRIHQLSLGLKPSLSHTHDMPFTRQKLLSFVHASSKNLSWIERRPFALFMHNWRAWDWDILSKVLRDGRPNAVSSKYLS